MAEFVIVIRRLASGQVEVKAPPDLVACYGLLEFAKDTIREGIKSMEAGRSDVIAAKAQDVPGLVIPGR